MTDEIAKIESIETATRGFADVKRQLLLAQEIQMEVIGNIKDGFALWNHKDILIVCNARFQSLFFEIKAILKPGLSYKEFITAAYESEIFLPAGNNFEQQILKRLERRKSACFPYDERLTDGRWIHVHECKTPQQRTVSIFTDITEKKQSQIAVKNMVETDSLTGLYNRTIFNEHLGRIFELSKAGSKMFGVMFLDIDHFKSLNDTMGHRVGDALLSEVATRLRVHSRATDIIARLGGDEFAIITPDINDPTDMDIFANRIISALAETCHLETAKLQVSASIGVAVYPVHNTSPDELIRNADMALYKAKKDGGNQFRRFDRKLDQESKMHREIEKSLQVAIRSNQFELHYQPQYNTSTGQIIGAEALIRWHHPELGMVPPSVFIPIAESTNLILPISNWVVETACKQTKLWQEQGLPKIVVAVNVSPVQFKQHDLPNFIARVLEQTQLEPKWLEIEVTEGVAMEPDCQRQFEKIKEMGTSIAIDDFGTGYSSLSQLINFSIDRLKIDRSFVTSIDQDSERRAVFSAIVNMARSLNINVIAEGIETEQELSTIKAQGCKEAQGFFFCRPLPETSMTELLANHNSIQMSKNFRNLEIAFPRKIGASGH